MSDITVRITRQTSHRRFLGTAVTSEDAAIKRMSCAALLRDLRLTDVWAIHVQPPIKGGSYQIWMVRR